MIFKNAYKKIIKVYGFLINLIFPVECYGCGRDGKWVCDKCFEQLRFKSRQYCFGCKSSDHLGVMCKSCKSDYYLDGISIAGDYDDRFLAFLIKEFKYHFIAELGPVLTRYLLGFFARILYYARIIADNSEQFPIMPNKKLVVKFLTNITKYSIIIPVPLSKNRMRWRGFNQAELIAAMVGKQLCMPIDNKILFKKRFVRPQAGLSQQHRLNNCQGVYSCQKGLEGKNILLIDDIITTGATLNECARVLKENGANIVWGLVVAKG